MTDQNYRPRPLKRPVDGVAPDPLEIAARALEGIQPATESWFTNPNLHAAPGQAPAPRYTPYSPAPRDGQIPGVDGLPQRTPGASRAPQGSPRPDASFFQPARPSHRRPMPAHDQLPQQAFQPNPYAAQQPRLHPARPMMYANPAMPAYAAAQAPTHKPSFIDQGPEAEGRGRGKKAILLPLAAMAIASAAIGAFAQANVGPETDVQAQTQQVKAHSNQIDASPVIEYVGDQEVVGAPGVIVPDGSVPSAEISPAVERATAGGKHSSGNYDAPSSAESYGGSHSSSGTVSAPSGDSGSGGGDQTSDPAPAPAPAPAPEPEPEPEPQPEPKQPTLGENVVAPTLDATTGVVGTLTGINLDLTR
ncbi:hypothetical protein FB381_0647 [Nocardioides albertanoniae]|uniref:Uncharacterized protein n=1 Tax=Nocardioides albertanoniae TaxID=1175486 RepID=A0A543A2I3_9ACTN|nr:hypothetical protein [Nocardioides albertanoniae]TQL66781.1 hypothetical protein FB381_0647 [Nocardioides albertanoniae]